MADICMMEQRFTQIWSEQRIISNDQLIKEILKDNVTGKCVCSLESSSSGISQLYLNISKYPPTKEVQKGRHLSDGTANDIGTGVDLIEAVRHYDLGLDNSPDRDDFDRRCYQTGQQIPVDFTLAAEDLQKTVICKQFGCGKQARLLPRKGEAADKRGELAVRYYETSACQCHAAGLCKCGCCPEYAKQIGQDPILAATGYRRSAESKEPSTVIVLESILNGELVFIPIHFSQYVMTKGQLNTVILMVQTNSDSAWSMAVVSNKIWKQQQYAVILLVIDLLRSHIVDNWVTILPISSSIVSNWLIVLGFQTGATEVNLDFEARTAART
jgi:hypothetical protein